MLLYQNFAFRMHGKIQKNNKFKISTLTWNKDFELADG